MAPEELTKSVLENIINSFRESALVVDREGKILYANSAFAKNVNKKLEEVLDKIFYDLFSLDVARRRKSNLEQVIRTKKSSSFEDERSGRYFIAHMTPMIDARGGVDKVLIIAYDITEKKKLEKELINSREQLISILNSIDEKIYIADLETYEILYTNTYTKGIFGFDIEGKKCYEVLHKFDKPCEFCPNEILLKLNGEPYKVEKYNPLTNRHYSMINKIIKWTDGRDVKFCLGADITDKKLAELSLKEREERHRKIIENLSEGFFRTTPEGKYIMANPALASLYGYSNPEELIADTKNIAEHRFVNREDYIYLVEHLEKDGYIKNHEALRKRKDGSIFWGLTNTRAVRDENGKTLYYEGTTVDITDRKHLEEEILEEKEKLSTLIDHAPFGMALIDSDGTYLYVNPTFTKLFGYDLKDIPDRDTWFKKAYPDDKYRKMAHDAWHYELERFGSGETTPQTLTVTCKDGTKKKVEIKPVILPNRQFIMAFTDVTEKERLEVNYRFLFENAPVGIVQSTLNGDIIIANQAFAKMFQYDSFEELKENVTNIKQLYASPQEREKLIEIIKSGGRIKGYETQGLAKDGTKRWGSISMVGIHDEKGDIIYIQSIVEDITDRKKKEEELERLKAQYSHAQKMEALGTLTGGIAHDINNFLTAVMGYANIMKIKLAGKPDIQRYLDQIISGSEKMADLVKSLLFFSRKQPVNLIPLDLNNEIKETKKLVKRVLTENIDFKVITSDKNPVVMADKTQLSQILFNMATNSRDAMPDGGTFTIKIDTATIDGDFIKKHGFGNTGDYALISISDTGIGIDKEIMDKIFDPFFTTKGPNKGTGLGLASVYGIVKQHNGYITVDSVKGKGTTFKIYFPLVNLKAKEEKKEEMVLQKGSGTILLGEDDENVRNFLKEVLEQYGYTIYEAEDGEKLIELFKQKEHIDLVITDMIMPKKSGVEVYSEIKAIKENTRFIFMSGYDREMVSKIPLEDKTVKFILKPISVNTLIKTFQEILKSEYHT